MSSFACGGKCCQSFPLNFSPEDVGKKYVHAMARRAAGVPLSDFERDVIYIAEMVIRIDEDDEASPRYGCRHFDEKAGRCSAYEQRPAMCRDYPNYGGDFACLYCGFSEPLPSLSPSACPGQQSPEP